MFYLAATILLNVLLSVIFKLFPKYNINTLQAIVVNYCVCVVTGCFFVGEQPFHAAALAQPWFPWALLMGCGFISIFNLLAFCTRIDGITTTTIANKLSLVIPVLFAVWLFGEAVGIVKIAGILLAFPAVYLTSRVKEENGRAQNLFWPIVLFIGSGLLDTLMNFVQHTFLHQQHEQAVFAIFTFATAGTLGILLIASLGLLKKIQLHRRNVIAGICVGIPNYFSIYYLIRALNSHIFQSSATIPVLNIGILVVSGIAAFVVFREKMNGLRIAGLILSVLAIVLIAWGDR